MIPTAATPKTQVSINDQAARYGIRVFWLHVNPPEEFILSKLRAYKHTWLFKDSDEAVKKYYSRKPLHENLTLDFTYTFDTSRSDLTEQLDDAYKVIVHKLHAKPMPLSWPCQAPEYP